MAIRLMNNRLTVPLAKKLLNNTTLLGPTLSPRDYINIWSEAGLKSPRLARSHADRVAQVVQNLVTSALRY